MAKPETIRIEDIVTARHQPRSQVGDVSDLVEGIDQVGITTAITGRRRADGKVEVLTGNRRYAAAKQAGEEAMYVLVLEERELDPVLVWALQYGENKRRKALSPVDDGRAVLEMKLRLDCEQLAKKLGEIVRERAGQIAVRRAAIEQLEQQADQELLQQLRTEDSELERQAESLAVVPAQTEALLVEEESFADWQRQLDSLAGIARRIMPNFVLEYPYRATWEEAEKLLGISPSKRKRLTMLGNVANELHTALSMSSLNVQQQLALLVAPPGMQLELLRAVEDQDQESVSAVIIQGTAIALGKEEGLVASEVLKLGLALQAEAKGHKGAKLAEQISERLAERAKAGTERGRSYVQVAAGMVLIKLQLDCRAMAAALGLPLAEGELNWQAEYNRLSGVAAERGLKLEPPLTAKQSDIIAAGGIDGVTYSQLKKLQELPVRLHQALQDSSLTLSQQAAITYKPPSGNVNEAMRVKLLHLVERSDEMATPTAIQTTLSLLAADEQQSVSEVLQEVLEVVADEPARKQEEVVEVALKLLAGGSVAGAPWLVGAEDEQSDKQSQEVEAEASKDRVSQAGRREQVALDARRDLVEADVVEADVARTREREGSVAQAEQMIREARGLIKQHLHTLRTLGETASRHYLDAITAALTEQYQTI